MEKGETFIDIINPEQKETVLVYDVQADESGALSILLDFYNQVKSYYDKSVRWIFVISTPVLDQTENIVIERYPWVKKSWFHRLKFEYFNVKRIIEKYNPTHLFSLQNKCVEYYHGNQVVYLHMSLFLSDHKFSAKNDGRKLWLYQNVVGKMVLSSLKKADRIIVQTKWMKDSLVKKTRIDENKVTIQHPNLEKKEVYQFIDSERSYREFFYPATAFPYKNHWTLIRAIKIAQDCGMTNYKLTLTINRDENKLTKEISDYVEKHHLSVDFVGKIKRDDVYKKYAESIMIFPSYMESFGLPLLEARETGCPIIASDTPFAHEILDGYAKAMFFPEMDETILSKQIISMYQNHGNVEEDS